MNIDNSRANAFRTCPWMYYEQFERNGTGVEQIKKADGGYSPLELGSRVHELLEVKYKLQQNQPAPDNAPPANGSLESEAQWILQAYNAYYPNDNWDILDVERTFKIALPNFCPKCYSSDCLETGDDDELCRCLNCNCMYLNHRHTAIGKMDVFYRDLVDGNLYIMDHKTEKRGAKSNLPQKWASRDQASLYLWAAERLYKEPVSNFVVNVLTRPSEAGKVGPSFPERQKLERTPIQIQTAIRDLVIVADDIQRYKRIFGDGPWPANREQCYGWGTCEYYQLHTFGPDVDLILQHKFAPKKEYLNLVNIETTI
jgi:PD-(D/E)XK nuclease superfamily